MVVRATAVRSYERTSGWIYSTVDPAGTGAGRSHAGRSSRRDHAAFPFDAWFACGLPGQTILPGNQPINRKAE